MEMESSRFSDGRLQADKERDLPVETLSCLFLESLHKQEKEGNVEER